MVKTKIRHSWEFLEGPKQNNYINLQILKMSSYMQRISFIAESFLGIFELEKTCNLIRRQDSGSQLKNKNFPEHGVSDGKPRITRTLRN